MLNKNLTKAEIKKGRDKCANLGIAVCMASIVGIILSPSILITVAITAVGGGAEYIALQKVKKLNEEEKKLEGAE